MDYENKFIKLHEANCKIRHTEIGEVFRILELIRTLNNLRKNEAVDDVEFLTLKDFIIRKVDPVYKVPANVDEVKLTEEAPIPTTINDGDKLNKIVENKGFVEKDSLLDESEYNRLANKVGKFKEDFERINVGPDHR